MVSRLYKLGSIFSRTEVALRKKIISENEKPLWYDVYAHFPPKYEPLYARETPKTEIRQILYQEDVARAKIHKILPDVPVNLKSTETSTTQKGIELYNDLIAKGMPEDEVLSKVKETFANRSKKVK